MAKKSAKRDEKSTAFRIANIVLWPFRMVFVVASWILEGIIIGFDELVGLLSKSAGPARAKRGSGRNIDEYVPLRIIREMHGEFSSFEEMLLNKDSTIGIILGARGSGKSAFGMKMLENLHARSRRKIFALGFDVKDLPSWIRLAQTTLEIENDSYVLIDEGGILFSARQGFSDANQLLSELLLIARHKDLSIMFITQNSANLEINVIRQADYLVLKPSSLLQMDFERKKIKDIYDDVAELFDKYRNTKGLTYIYSDAFKGFVSNPIPSFWTNRISKGFREK